MKTKPYYTEDNISLYVGDSIKVLSKLPEKSVDVIFADPPYFLSNDGISVSSGKQVSVNKAEWDKGGKDIKVYKFRTMYSNANEIFENFTPQQKEEYYKNFKLDNDPRVTKLGGFLRKTSLDELPQLFNILKGDMTIIGPRPIVEQEVEKYGDKAEKLFSVVPGLGGYWQANGRSDTTYEERVEMDMYYIDHMCFTLDAKILFQTIFSVLKGEGAI